MFKHHKAWGAALVLALAAQVAHAGNTVAVASATGGSVLTASAGNSTSWVFTLGSAITNAITFSASAKSAGSTVPLTTLKLYGGADAGTLTQLPGGNNLFLKLNNGLQAGTYTLVLGAANTTSDDYKVVTNLTPSVIGQIAQVPEPQAWALALAGTALAAMRMGRRRG